MSFLVKLASLARSPKTLTLFRGAREFSFVDGITGLSGTCGHKSSAYFVPKALTVLSLIPNAGDALNLFLHRFHQSQLGAIEYTVAAFGPVTLFCDQYGIRSVEQTDVYGDFIGRPCPI